MRTDSRELENMEVTVPAALVVQSHGSSSTDSEAIGRAIGEAFGRIRAFQAAHRITTCERPRVVYTGWTPDRVNFTAAVPITGAPPPDLRDTPDVSIVSLPESRALLFVHHGPYREIRATYDRIEAWLRKRGAIKSPEDWARYSPMWEEYVNDPQTAPESELVTRIYLTLNSGN